MTARRASESLALLEARCRALPGHLRSLPTSFDAELPAHLAHALVTGGGMSEGPAQLLVALLGELGVSAAYVPLSEFVAPAVRGAGDTLVLFSQGLAPNARFPLLHANAFRHVFVVTSVEPSLDAPSHDPRRIAAEAERGGARVVRVPPADEGGLLLRVMGPAIAALAAVLLARPLLRRARRTELEASIAQVAGAYERALASVASPLLVEGELAPIALVASGRHGAACHGHRWKLLEGLLVPDPPVWDVLQVAHGPLQSLYERPHTLVALERDEAAHEHALVDRLAEVLVPGRHVLHRIRARLPGLLAWFEHDAELDARLLATLRERPVDLASWPGKDRDGPLYGIAPPPS